jgi:hypothetical protein
MKVSALMFDYSILSGQIKIDEPKPLNQRRDKASAMGRNESILFFNDNRHA